MTRRPLIVAGALLATSLALAAGVRACRQGAIAMREHKTVALTLERESLRKRLGALIAKDKRFKGMPPTPVGFGVPTSLARALIQRTAKAFLDEVSIVLDGVKVDVKGKVKKVLTLGTYQLHLTIDRLSGALMTGKPGVTFGDNGVTLALPVVLARGTGHATLDFVWDGKNVAQMLCGDLTIRDVAVEGTIAPDHYLIQGTFVLSSGDRELRATPQFPTTKVRLAIVPSEGSWAKVQAIFDQQSGACGLVLDRLDVISLLGDLLARGVNVRLPTEKLRPISVPVAVQQSMTIRGNSLTFGVLGARVAVTKWTVWLGAEVTISPGGKTSW